MIFDATVVIPLYNKEQYIERAINSVLNQLLPIKKIIIVDDGSTDDGAKRIQNLSNNNITLIKQANKGVSAARNKGIQACDSQYVLLLDADDYWLEHFTSEIYALSQKYPNAGILATAYAFKENKQIINAQLRATPKSNGLLKSYFSACLNADLPITSSSVALKKSAVESVGLFPIGMKMGEDQLVWSRISYQYQIAYSGKISVYYDRNVDNSACKVNLITEPAPHIKYWQSDITNKKVPKSEIPYLKKLLHYSILYCVKNNLKLGQSKNAQKLLFKHPLIQKDKYWLIAILLTYCPLFIVNRVI